MSRRQTLPNFTEWDYDTGVVTEYERIGECNQCGDCCKIRFNISMIEGDKQLHGGTGTNGKGRWSETFSDQGDRSFIQFIPTEEPDICVAFDACNNSCMEEGLERKSWACQVFPTIPNDMKFLPNCSYEFIKVSEYSIEELEDAETE